MENIREASEIAKKYGISPDHGRRALCGKRLFHQTARTGIRNKSIREIVREMFSYADAFTMSAKKDGLVKSEGFWPSTRTERNCTNRPVPWRSRRRLPHLRRSGRPGFGGAGARTEGGNQRGISQIPHPSGGVFGTEIAGWWNPDPDAARRARRVCRRRKLLPHIPPHQFPGQVLANELYLECGVRSVEIGSLMLGRDPETGEQLKSPLELVRLAIPRRVYTYNHMDFVADGLIAIKERADQLVGLEFTYEPKVLRHFTARLKLAQ